LNQATVEKSVNDQDTERDWQWAWEGRNQFDIPVQNIPEMKKRIDKLNAKAEKLDVPKVWVAIGQPFPKKEYPGQIFYPVTVFGEAPILKGWIFAGKITHMADVDTPLVNMAGKDIPIPPQYMEGTAKCDHCGMKRKRTKTFILWNDDAKEWKQVGRNCLEDFLGNDPNKVVWAMSILAELQEAMGQAEEMGGSGGAAAVWIEEYLGAAAMLIRTYGWVSKSKAEGNQIPTVSRIDNRLFDPKSEERRVIGKKIDTAIATEALEWGRALDDDDNDYFHNLKVAALRQIADERTFGLLASLIPAMQHAQETKIEREIEKQARIKSAHFGTAGKREVFELTLIRRFVREGDYGYTYIQSFVDQDGNQAVWFGSREVEMQIGETRKLKATIKAHENYKGGSQTVLTRVKEEG